MILLVQGTVYICMHILEIYIIYNKIQYNVYIDSVNVHKFPLRDPLSLIIS